MEMLGAPSDNKKEPIVPVILAGGVGSRLWPLSREMHPKPFIKLDDGLSLIQKTYERVKDLSGVEEILTVTNRELFFYTKDEYEEISEGEIFNTFLLEPCGRNSSAAIALAAQFCQKKYGSACTLLILPSDHLIDNQSDFVAAVAKAVSLAEQGQLVTFGIHPDSPKTGYGYIEAEGNKVKRFVEKPSLTLAQEYVASGKYFWNSGMFCMQAGTILEEMTNHCSDIVESTDLCLKKASHSEGSTWLQVEIGKHLFEQVRDISIDYAVFEKSSNVSVVACDLGWSDIGSWIEFGQLSQQDKNNNYISGEAVLDNVHDCIIHAESKMIAGIGLKDLIIADTQDALLIADKANAQDVRKIVKLLKEQSHPSYQQFPTVHRPWGSYTVLQQGESFKLKRLEVKPGAMLSLQSHVHRSEHWVVVSGRATVVNGSNTLQLAHNESTYIPAGHKHRLANAGKEPLILIEVQCGACLDESDVVRYEDVYDRQSKVSD